MLERKGKTDAPPVDEKTLRLSVQGWLPAWLSQAVTSQVNRYPSWARALERIREEESPGTSEEPKNTDRAG